MKKTVMMRISLDFQNRLRGIIKKYGEKYSLEEGIQLYIYDTLVKSFITGIRYGFLAGKYEKRVSIDEVAAAIEDVIGKGAIFLGKSDIFRSIEDVFEAIDKRIEQLEGGRSKKKWELY